MGNRKAKLAMSDHAELIAELPVVEKMTNQERLKHAKKRRIEQLKRYSRREKELHKDFVVKKKRTETNMKNKRPAHTNYKVHFVDSVMLLESAARGDIEEVKRLLSMEVDPDSTNDDGLTALHQCCIDNNEEMLKLLIQYKANVNAEDSEKWTPLHAAATCGHINLVAYLINSGGDLLAVNADGNMPYDICEDEHTLDFIESEMSKKGVTQELIDETRAATERRMLRDLKRIAANGGDLEFRDKQNATPLHIAAANGYNTVVSFLLEKNVALEACDADLWQPIHAAACWGHIDVLEMLVHNGADLNAKTKNGETPYDICEDVELKDKIMYLKNEIDIKNNSQPQKIRRTQSQSSRSQVRRTSIRDKRVLSKQEAAEEAKIRIEHHEKITTQNDLEEKNKNDLEEKNKENSERSKTAIDKDGNGNKSGPKVAHVKPFPQDEKQHSSNTRNTDVANVNVKSTEVKNVTKNGELMVEGESTPKIGTTISTVQTKSNGGMPVSQADVKVSITVTVDTRHSAAPTSVQGTGSNDYIVSSGSTNTTLANLKAIRRTTRIQTGTVSLDTASILKQNGHGVELTSITPKVESVPGNLTENSTPVSEDKDFSRKHSNIHELYGPPEKRGCCIIM